MKNLSSHLNTSNTPVTEKKDENQVLNNAGGYVYEVTPEIALQRFLILGSEGGTFYQTERALTVENATRTIALIKSNPKFVLDETIRVSDEGLARKNDFAILVFALLLTHGNDETKSRCIENVGKICRTGTHMFTLAQYIKDLRGWGTVVKKVFTKWYAKKVSDLAFQMIKYQSRNGWNHGDVITLSHIKPASSEYTLLFNWALNGTLNKDELKVEDYPDLKLIIGFEKAKKCTTENEIIPLIKEYGLTREMIPTQFLNKPSVIAVMLPNMGITSVLRSLGSWTACGFLNNNDISVLSKVTDMFNEIAIKKARLHPIQILEAFYTYENGRGFKGDLTWIPIRKISDALNEAFYVSFKTVVPTGKNIMLGLDISASMGSGNCTGSILNPRQMSIALAMVTARSEKNYWIKGFSHYLIDLNITPKMGFDEIHNYISRLSFGSTNPSLLFQDAIDNKLDVDTFVFYTDNECNEGVHVDGVLKKYRKVMKKPNAKLIVVGMTSTGFTVANPKDPFQYDVVGASSDTPALISTLISL